MDKITPSDDAICIAAATLAAALLQADPAVTGSGLERQKEALASAFAWSIHRIQIETDTVAK